jgi:hypothetical protein
MTAGVDGQSVTSGEEHQPELERPSAEQVPKSAGQMFKIRKGVEALLGESVPLSLLGPTQAWQRITDHLRETGVNALEMPHRSTFNRFRKKYGSRFGLR